MAAGRSASAQTAEPAFEIAATFMTTDSGQFHTKDVGGGGRLGWRVTPLLGVEGEITYHSEAFGDGDPISGGRVEGLFGVTVGPSLGIMRPFVTARPGFVRYRAKDEPVACVATFPPPVSCRLAAGHTAFAFDLGGGLEVSPTPRTVVRAAVSDRMVRYPAPAFDTSGERHDDSFTGHDLRIAIGAGFRF
jgi:opacity protein-like surface antigen